MKLGQRLRGIRREHDLTLKDLGSRADLSVPYLSNVERGTVNPSIETLQKIAAAYNMAVRDLLTDVEGLGNAVKPDYPAGFQELLQEYEDEMDGDWVDLLLRINLRGKRPTSKREWEELYLHLRRMLDPQGI